MCIPPLREDKHDNGECKRRHITTCNPVAMVLSLLRYLESVGVEVKGVKHENGRSAAQASSFVCLQHVGSGKERHNTNKDNFRGKAARWVRKTKRHERWDTPPPRGVAGASIRLRFFSYILKRNFKFRGKIKSTIALTEMELGTKWAGKQRSLKVGGDFTLKSETLQVE